MKEPHAEGVATHGDPESCVHAREGVGEALTGAGAGRISSREKKLSRVPTLLAMAEGNMRPTANARWVVTRRGRRPRARTEPSWTGTGRSTARLQSTTCRPHRKGRMP
jgi:RNA-directed DNA polymerase